MKIMNIQSGRNKYKFPNRPYEIYQLISRLKHKMKQNEKTWNLTHKRKHKSLVPWQNVIITRLLFPIAIQHQPTPTHIKKHTKKALSRLAGLTLYNSTALVTSRHVPNLNEAGTLCVSFLFNHQSQKAQGSEGGKKRGWEFHDDDGWMCVSFEKEFGSDSKIEQKQLDFVFFFLSFCFMIWSERRARSHRRCYLINRKIFHLERKKYLDMVRSERRESWKMLQSLWPSCCFSSELGEAPKAITANRSAVNRLRVEATLPLMKQIQLCRAH